MDIDSGIKETKEFVLGCIKLGKFIAAQAADGLDWSDALALGQKLAMDASFRDGLLEAIKDCQKIPGECGDLSWSEGVELATVAIAELKK